MWYYCFSQFVFLFSVTQISTVLGIIILINSSVVTGIHRHEFCKDCKLGGCICRGPILHVFSPYALAETSRVTFPWRVYFNKLIISEGAVTNTFYNKSGICAKVDADIVPNTVYCQTIIDKAPLYNHIKHLEIIGNLYLTFFSKNALSLFPELETLTLSENIRLTNVPVPHANDIKSITYENNDKIETVAFSKTFKLSNLESFTYISSAKSDTNLTIEKISLGTSCKNFKVSANTNNLQVQLPICKNITVNTQSVNVTIVLPRFQSTEKVNVFNVAYCPHTKGNFTILRDGHNENFIKMSFTICLADDIYALPYISQDLRHFIYETQPNLRLTLHYPSQSDKKYTLKYINLLTNTPSNNIFDTFNSNYNAIKDLTAEYFPPEIEYDGENLTLDYVVVEMTDLLKKISEVANQINDPKHEKKYIVNTYLLLSNGNVIYHIDHLIINYKLLFPLANPTVYYFEYEDGKVGFSITQWNPKLVYKVLHAALMLATPRLYQTSEEKDIKNLLFEKLINSFDQNGFNKLKDNVQPEQKHFLPDILSKRVKIYYFFKKEAIVALNIPRGSRNLYKEKTIVYQEIAKNYIKGKRFHQLFHISKFKSQSQQYIIDRELEHLYQEKINVNRTLCNVTISRKKYEEEVKNGKDEFQKAVEKRQTHAIVEAIFSVFDAITNIFSSVYNVGHAISRIHKKFQGIQDTLKSIRLIITKLNELDKKVIKRWKTRTRRFKKTASGAIKIVQAEHLVNIAQEGFDPDVDGIKEDLGNIDAADLLKWNKAKSDIETMMDAALTAEIPETYNFKKSILRMIETGKAETQLRLELIRLNACIVLKDYEGERYRKEEAIVDDIIKNKREEPESNILKENYHLSIKQFKLDLFLHVVDFCEVSLYHSLQSCYTYKLFRYDTNLEEMIFLTNRMLVEEIDNLNDLFPQSFSNKRITFKWDGNCNNITNKYNLNVTLSDEESIIYGRCINSVMYQLKENKTFSFNVPLYHKQFKFFDRIRIEDVKIITRGVSTNNNWLEVNLESGNIQQDKFQGKKFVFNTEKWKRVFFGPIRTKDNCDTPYGIAADVDKNFRQEVSLPTPFTDWTFTIPILHNPGLNLERVRSVTFQFAGNVQQSSFVSETPRQSNYQQILEEIKNEEEALEENVSSKFFKEKKSSFLNSTTSKLAAFGRDGSGKEKYPNIKLDKIVLENNLRQQILQKNVTTYNIEKNRSVENAPTERVKSSPISILTFMSDAKKISEEEYNTTVAIADLIPSKTTTLNSPSKTVILNYVVVELKTALQELKEVITYDEEEKIIYVISTYILLCNGNNTHDIEDLKINYKLSFILGSPTISIIEGLQFNIRNISIESLYDAMFAILIIAKPTMLYDNQKDNDFTLRNLFRIIKQIDYRKLKKITQIEKHRFVDNAIIKMQSIFEYWKEQSQDAITIPRTSNKLLKEKTKTLQEIGKNLISQEGFQNLLKISKVKSQTQEQISVKEQEQLNTKLENVEKMFNYSRTERKFYHNEVMQNRETFQDAVRRRQSMAVTEAVFAVFDVATSLSSGMFNVAGAIKRVAKNFKTISEAFKKIREILKKLRKFDKEMRPIWTKYAKKFKKIWEGSVKVVDAEKAINVAQHGFDPDVQGILNDIGNIDAADMLNWNIAKTDIETMMDSALTNEIPETYAYKKSLMRMIEAGKAETEAMLEKAKLQAKITLKEFEIKQYRREVALIQSKTAELGNEERINIQDSIRKISLVEFNIDMFLNSVKFCDSSTYHTLKKCLVYDQYRYDTTPAEIIEITNRWLNQHSKNTADVYPPPQSFHNLGVTFKWDRTCHNIIKTHISRNSDKQTVRAYQNCINSKMYQLVQNKSMTFDISLHHTFFKRFDRVRIDEIKVYITGIKAKSNYIQVNIETGTIFQDKFKGEQFTFHGNSWKRTFRYKSKSSHGKNRVDVFGDIYKDFAENVNSPSIFTRWTIILPKKENKGLDLSKTTQVDILFSGSLILSEYSVPNPNVLDMGFLETGESSNGKEEKEIEESRRFDNLEDMEKKRTKKDIEIKEEELETVT